MSKRRGRRGGGVGVAAGIGIVSIRVATEVGVTEGSGPAVANGVNAAANARAVVRVGNVLRRRLRRDEGVGEVEEECDERECGSCSG